MNSTSTMNRTLLAIIGMLICSLSFSQSNFDTVKIVPHRLSDHLYFLTGAGGNIGVLVGTDGTLMVDDQFAPLSNRINGAIKTLDPGDIRFVLNTHIHGDHSGGNENFARMGSTVIAQDNVLKRMSTSTVNSKTKEVTPPRDSAAWPVVTFPNSMSIHLNGEDIELIHLGPAHTDGDVAIWFKKANVFHLGDMFVTYGYPYIDYEGGGSISGFVSNLDKLLALMNDKTRVIPGHGPLCSKTDVQKFRDTLADIRDQILVALRKGKQASEVSGLEIATKYDAAWGKGFMKGKDFVFQAAENLKTSLPPPKK
jgi:cyclase